MRPVPVEESVEKERGKKKTEKEKKKKKRNRSGKEQTFECFWSLTRDVTLYTRKYGGERRAMCIDD